MQVDMVGRISIDIPIRIDLVDWQLIRRWSMKHFKTEVSCSIFLLFSFVCDSLFGSRTHQIKLPRIEPIIHFLPFVLIIFPRKGPGHVKLTFDRLSVAQLFHYIQKTYHYYTLTVYVTLFSLQFFILPLIMHLCQLFLEVQRLIAFFLIFLARLTLTIAAELLYFVIFVIGFLEVSQLLLDFFLVVDANSLHVWFYLFRVGDLVKRVVGLSYLILGRYLLDCGFDFICWVDYLEIFQHLPHHLVVLFRWSKWWWN